MSLILPAFKLAGAELDWPIGSAAGMTNHPDIEVVATRFEGYASCGLGFVTLGSFKLGDPDGGNGYVQMPDGNWDYTGGDEHKDVENGYFYNAKKLPGPGVYSILKRIDDFVDLARSKNTEITISFSPHSNSPLEEIDDLLYAAEISLNAGVLFAEINLSCPNLEGRPAFYKDYPSVVAFYEKAMQRESALRNRFGVPGVFPKFGPMEQTQEEIDLQNIIWNGTQRRYGTFGGAVTSNTVGNQHPKNKDGSDAIKVNGGKAGASGPALEYEGWRQLALWQGVAKNYQDRDMGEFISVLGIKSGNEVLRRLRLGASACEIGSILYCPELIGEESPEAVVERIKEEFVEAIAA